MLTQRVPIEGLSSKVFVVETDSGSLMLSVLVKCKNKYKKCFTWGVHKLGGMFYMGVFVILKYM